MIKFVVDLKTVRNLSQLDEESLNTELTQIRDILVRLKKLEEEVYSASSTGGK